MRIAFITPTLIAGGYEKVIIAYANELNRRGHQVDLLCGEKKGELIDTIESGIELYDFQARARQFFGPLNKYLKDNKVDILYSAFREYNSISVLAKKYAKSDVCIYATQHGFQENNRVICRLYGRIISKADRLITVAGGIADYEAEQLHLDRNRFITFHNPVIDKRIPVKPEYHPWFEERDSVPVIAVSGRLAEDKGKIYCIKVLAELLKKKRVRMIILGDGPTKKDVIALSKELRVDEYVDLLGYVNNPMGYLVNCTLFLHTAIVEGFGNIIVEALYANLPVCTSDCSGPLEIIENGKYGMILGSVNSPDFAEKAANSIMKILDGEISFSGLTDRAYCYEVSSSTDEFLNCLESVDGKKS